MKTVCVTLCRRIAETQQLLRTLAECHDFNDYCVILSCDQDARRRDASEEVYRIAKAWAKNRNAEVFHHNPALGIDLNKLFVMGEAFQSSDYVILLEDDTMPAPDALLYFEQVGQLLKVDPRYWSVCGYNRLTTEEGYAEAIHHPYQLQTKVGFCPWGWATWRDRWNQFFGDGGENYKASVDEPNGRFDWFLHEDREHLQAFPLLARIEAVSAPYSVHTPSVAWHEEHEANPFGAWKIDNLRLPTIGDWSFDV